MNKFNQKARTLIFFCVSAIIFFFYHSGIKISAQNNDSNLSIKPTPTPVETDKSEIEIPKTSVGKTKIGETEIRIVRHRTSRSKPVYFRPHENEATSSSAAIETLKKHGGTFIELKSEGRRNIDFLLKKKKYSLDPNRIFSRIGIEKTLIGGNRSPAEKKAAVREISDFVDHLFEQFLNDEKLIVAVHNNTNGGGLSIETFKNNPDAADVFINESRDADDFFYVTERRHFEALKKKGFNAVLQDNANVADDGSLSVYCGKRGIAYINVESEHGQLRRQIEMLDALQDLFGEDE